MRLATLSFLCGILIVQTFSQLPTIHWSLCLPFLGLMLWSPTRWLGFFILGILWAIWRAEMILSQELPAVLEGQNVMVIGEIIDLPIKREEGWHFLFAPTTATFQGKNLSVPKRLRLAWYIDKRKQSPLPDLHPGQQWLLNVRLKRARSSLNPGVFDYSQWLFQQGIRAVGYVRNQNEYRLLGQSTWQVDNLRFQIMQAMHQALGHHTSTGMLIALVLGNKQTISQSQRDVLQRTGIMHLMVISGLHIGLIATLTFGLAKWFWSYVGVLWLSPIRFAALFSFISAFSYALLAGFTLPTQRALIMLGVALFSMLIPRMLATSYTLSLALLLVLIYDPLAVLNAGFWLTFGIITALLYANVGMSKQYSSRLLKWGLGAFKTQIVATLASLPILLFVFGYIPLTTFFTNTIAIPWMSLVIVPLTLMSAITTLLFPMIGNLCLNFTADLLEALWVSITWLANLPASTWYSSLPPLWTLFPVAIGIFTLLLPRGFPGRWLGFIWFLPLFFVPIPAPKQGEVWFTLLDVGQGLASVIRTQHHVLVYDTGSLISETADIGKMVIVPFLQGQGIRKVDTIVVSHGHDDHSGGVRSIVEKLSVGKVLTSNVAKLMLDFNAIYPCQASQQWQWDGVHFQILHPASDFLTYRARDNNYSCVLKISAPNGSILLTGDIQKEAEAYLVAHDTSTLDADIVLAPHHGSKTSSNLYFLEAVTPKLAVVSTGYLNRWQFPSAEVTQRYKDIGIPLLNTESVGAITLQLTAKGISKPSFARESMRRYWHE